MVVIEHNITLLAGVEPNTPPPSNQKQHNRNMSTDDGRTEAPSSAFGIAYSTDHRRHSSEEPLLQPSHEHLHQSSSPSSQEDESPHPQTSSPLKVWSLAIIIFYTVSGGPYGVEPAIRSAGNFYAILGFIVFPFIFCIPEALVTAELGSSFRHASGGVAWVEEAFGESMGFLCGYLSWISGATDNAVYPVLFLEYVGSVLRKSDDDEGNTSILTGWPRFGYVAAITVILAYLNYRGLDIVGKMSLVVCIIAMSPFIVLTIISIGGGKIVPSRWLRLPENDNTEGLFDDDFETSLGPLSMATFGGILWRPYLNNMFWNLNSFDSASCFAAETSCVNSYTTGLFVGLFLVVIGYIIPLLVAVGATDYSQYDWVDGHLGTVAIDVGGSWLGVWTLFAAGISSLAQFEAEMSAYQLMGMAEKEFLPKIFKRRSKYGTPTMGIIAGIVVIISMGWADFGQLLELLNANYALSLLLEFAAFVKLRRCNSECKHVSEFVFVCRNNNQLSPSALLFTKVERPYRIPISDRAAFLVVLPPTLGIIAMFIVSNWHVYLYTSGTLLLGSGIVRVREQVSHERAVR